MTFEGALAGVQGVGLALLIGLELCAPAFRRGLLGAGDRARQRRNRLYLIAALGSSAASKAVLSPLRAHVPALVDVAAWSPVLDLVLCFLVADLVGWTSHWVKHRSARLWRLHFQHHREANYDLWLVTHTHAVEVVLSACILFGTLSLLGFSSAAVELYLTVYAVAKTYQHGSFDLSLGRTLDRLIVGPAYHRFHHEVGAQVNFANVLTLWDVVFRTARFPASARAPALELGTGDGPEPYGFAAELGWVLKDLGPEPDAARAPQGLVPAASSTG